MIFNTPNDSRPTVLGRNRPLRTALQIYIPAILFGYFGLVVLASSFSVDWLQGWFSLWTFSVDSIRQLLPIFDNVERDLITTGIAHRVPIIHHLLLVGWFLFLTAAIFCTILLVRMPRADWIRVAAARPVDLYMWSGLVCLLLFILPIFYVSIGLRLTGYVKFAWHRDDLQLLWIAVAFYIALVTWVAALAHFGAVFAAWGIKDRA